MTLYYLAAVCLARTTIRSITVIITWRPSAWPGPPSDPSQSLLPGGRLPGPDHHQIHHSHYYLAAVCLARTTIRSITVIITWRPSAWPGPPSDPSQSLLPGGRLPGPDHHRSITVIITWRPSAWPGPPSDPSQSLLPGGRLPGPDHHQIHHSHYYLAAVCLARTTIRSITVIITWRPSAWPGPPSDPSQSLLPGGRLPGPDHHQIHHSHYYLAAVCLARTTIRSITVGLLLTASDPPI